VPVDLSAHADLDELLSGIALDLAVYRLHARRPPIPADVIRQRDAALAWLGRVAVGALVLPAAVEVAGNSADGPVADNTGEARVITRDTLAGL
jgi:hypothetical protein